MSELINSNGLIRQDFDHYTSEKLAEFIKKEINEINEIFKNKATADEFKFGYKKQRLFTQRLNRLRISIDALGFKIGNKKTFDEIIPSETRPDSETTDITTDETTNVTTNVTTDETAIKSIIEKNPLVPQLREIIDNYYKEFEVKGLLKKTENESLSGSRRKNVGKKYDYKKASKPGKFGRWWLGAKKSPEKPVDIVFNPNAQAMANFDQARNVFEYSGTRSKLKSLPSLALSSANLGIGVATAPVTNLTRRLLKSKTAVGIFLGSILAVATSPLLLTQGIINAVGYALTPKTLEQRIAVLNKNEKKLKELEEKLRKTISKKETKISEKKMSQKEIEKVLERKDKEDILTELGVSTTMSDEDKAKAILIYDLNKKHGPHLEGLKAQFHAINNKRAEYEEKLGRLAYQEGREILANKGKSNYTEQLESRYEKHSKTHVNRLKHKTDTSDTTKGLTSRYYTDN